MSDTSPTTAPSARSDDRVWKVIAAVAGLLLAGFIAFVATRPHQAKPVSFPTARPTTLAVGSTAPAFALPRLGGGAPVTLADSPGTPSVVNFFASWCPNCQAELGNFAALAKRTAGRVAVVGVDANDGSGSAAQALLTKVHAAYPVGLDPLAATATNYLVSALPVTYFLDARGRVVHVALGSQTTAALNHWTDVLTGSTP